MVFTARVVFPSDIVPLDYASVGEQIPKSLQPFRKKVASFWKKHGGKKGPSMGMSSWVAIRFRQGTCHMSPLIRKNYFFVTAVFFFKRSISFCKLSISFPWFFIVVNSEFSSSFSMVSGNWELTLSIKSDKTFI